MKNFGLIMENWRSFKKVLKERVKPEGSYPATYKELKSMIEELSNKTWIFFDTETTGLFYEDPSQAITQIAAIKVKINNFEEDKDIEITERFNNLIQLNQKTVKHIQREEANWPNILARWKEKEQEKKLKFEEKEREKAEKNPNYTPKQYVEGKPPFTAAKALNMTGYMTLEDLESKYGITTQSIAEEEKAQNPAYKDTEEHDYLTPQEALRNFAEFCSPSEDILMVAQNTPFDVQFINIAFRRAGLEVPDDVAIDTVVIFKKFLSPVVLDLENKLNNGEIPEEQIPQVKHILKQLLKISDDNKKSTTVSLGPIRTAFKVQDEGWHNALADVIMLAKVMKEIINFLDKNEFVGTLDYSKEPEVAGPPEIEARIKELEDWLQTAPFTPRDAPEGWERGYTDKKTGEQVPPTAYYTEYRAKKDELSALRAKLRKAKGQRPPPADGKPSTIELSEGKVFRIKIRR
jgi:DNA polymerase III epsilon subunit-like protein